MCFAAYLWLKNEKEILKKILLSEIYKEVTNVDFALLDEQSTLMKAMQAELRGNDYPNDMNLKVSDNEGAKFNKLAEVYK